jgi:hypothetical protein
VRNRQSYPVFVEETTVRMIWVEADSAEDAAKLFSEYPSEYNYGQGAEPIDGWIGGVAPTEEFGRYDWDSVYGYTGGADEPDMHVTLHRIHLAEQAREAHAAIGHPGLTDREIDGKRWCPECAWWVDVPATEQAPTTTRPFRRR